MKRFFSALLALLLLPMLVLPALAAEDTDSLIQEILSCLLEGKSLAVRDQALKKLEDQDPALGLRWERILADWDWIQGEMPINEEVLPDGLPQDDSLAIVVMGYQLNPNGSIQPELLDRLQVALRSAQKYPNAYVICTGGPTSNRESVTEAGEMAAWLRSCGISEDRIITEDASYSTMENARNTCKILGNAYETIRHLAIVTSDYHIQRSCLMFQAAALYTEQDGLEVISNAVCKVDGSQVESLRTKVWGLAILADVEMPS